jgi:hypothetical protein
MTERKARTGARYAREKQVLRCAQNDNQKGKGNCKSSGYSIDDFAVAVDSWFQAETGPLMTFSKAVWKTSISWGVPTLMRT